jgi:polyphosphate kinase
MADTAYPLSFTQNRELSWLKFNRRVLCEARDETVPLLERLKFAAIFTSNLDEFFMIRVGSLHDLASIGDSPVDSKSGMTPSEQLAKIYQAVAPLYAEREEVFAEIERRLRVHGIYSLSMAELEPAEKKYVKNYYKTTIAPILSPQIVDGHHPFPHIQNKVIHVGARLKYKNREVFGMIPVPAALPEVLFLPGADLRYVHIDDIIAEYAPSVFNTYVILEQTKFCVTRNADISADDRADDETFDLDEDFRKKMKKLLIQRKRLAVVRLELSQALSPAFQQYLCEKLVITPEQIFVSALPMRMGYVYGLPAKLSAASRRILTYREFSPQPCPQLSPGERIMRQIGKKDVLLSYPYESMEPFLQLVREASSDPSVISIKITIYRLASKAKLVEYLCAAAENGKDVTVLIELRARFDEQNNIDWSERLEEAGCKLIYGFSGYKVHSKICLITRREKDGSIKYLTQVGTGNYNEKTAELYTDLALMTASPKLGADANEYFKNMAIGNLEGEYDYLLVAPVRLKSRILELIDEQIALGSSGRITLKMNSITDIEIIKKLSEASCAGVRIEMIVRGICCILPGVEGKTENITITSIVGRFLEHSRIFCFGSGAQEKMYISSADMMTRNTERRVEIACPIYDDGVKAKIHHILDTISRDNTKARVLLPNGNYVAKPQEQTPLSCQEQLMEDAERAASAIPARREEKRGFFARLRALFRG